MDAATATLYGAGIAGIFTLLGVVVGLFGERWVRSWGEVRCELDRWQATRTSVMADGSPVVLERRLDVTFLNRKDVTVTVWDMQVVFYRQGRPLEDWHAPT